MIGRIKFLIISIINIKNTRNTGVPKGTICNTKPLKEFKDLNKFKEIQKMKEKVKIKQRWEVKENLYGQIENKFTKKISKKYLTNKFNNPLFKNLQSLIKKSFIKFIRKENKDLHIENKNILEKIKKKDK